jgi:TRAP-type C4-dicarboxylate transport system permease small subunit
MFMSIVRHIEETLPALLLAVMTFVITIDVFGRYFFNHPIKGAAELAILLFVWEVFLAGSAALRRGLHVNVDFLVIRLPVRAQATIALIVDICILIVIVVTGFMGWEYAWEAQTKRIHTLHMPYTWAIMAVPVGCLLITIQLLWRICVNARSMATNTLRSNWEGFEGTGCIMPDESSDDGSGL